MYSKTCLQRPLKKNTKSGFQYRISLKCRSKVLQNAPREHSAILSTFIKLPYSIKTFVLSIFKWPLKTGLTVLWIYYCKLLTISNHWLFYILKYILICFCCIKMQFNNLYERIWWWENTDLGLIIYETLIRKEPLVRLSACCFILL